MSHTKSELEVYFDGMIRGYCLRLKNRKPIEPPLTKEAAYEAQHRYNCHDGLVAACEKSLLGLEYCLSNHKLDTMDKDVIVANIKQLDAALDKARR